MKSTLSFKLLLLLLTKKILNYEKNWIFYLFICHLHSANIYVYTFHKFHTFFYSPNHYHYHFSNNALLAIFLHSKSKSSSSLNFDFHLSFINQSFKISNKKQLNTIPLRVPRIDPLFTAIGHDLSIIALPRILSRTRVLSSWWSRRIQLYGRKKKTSVISLSIERVSTFDFKPGLQPEKKPLHRDSLIIIVDRSVTQGFDLVRWSRSPISVSRFLCTQIYV